MPRGPGRTETQARCTHVSPGPSPEGLGSRASVLGSGHGHLALWLLDLGQLNLSVLISTSGQLNQALLGNWYVLKIRVLFASLPFPSY